MLYFGLKEENTSRCLFTERYSIWIIFRWDVTLSSPAKDYKFDASVSAVFRGFANSLLELFGSFILTISLTGLPQATLHYP